MGDEYAGDAVARELREVNERLLLASLRQQDQATEARRLAEALEHRALHDALTDLPNRALFIDRLELTLLAARREPTTFALLFLDLDGCKAVNDRRGHHTGDLLLQQVAARLRDALRQSDTLARLYGDEFAVLLPGDDAAAAAGVARKLLRALAPPYLLHGQPERVAASIGIAVYPAHGPDADALMEQADAAMYTAKRARSGYAVAGCIEERQWPHPLGAELHDGAPAAAGPVLAGIAPVAPAREELQAVNERLLIAGLREHELADRLRRQLAFTSAITDNLGEGVYAIDRRVELLPLLEETVAEVGMAAPDFALRLDALARDAWVHGDPARLQQVLSNLLTNAVKYSARRREVAIGLRREGDRVAVTITDYGIGIPAAQQGWVFEPYFRATNAAGGAASGQGLGLFISKAIVDHHGGTLDVVSEEGRGSTFSLSLPALPAADAPGAKRREAQIAEPGV